MDDLAQRIEAYILGTGGDVEFDALALKLFERQYRLVDPYRRLCDSVGISPMNCERLSQIPLVPAAAFKRYDLSCVPVSQAVVVYHSSGTTASERSRHFLCADALALYRTSLRYGFLTAIPNATGKRIWALMPSSQQMPHSSLSAMLTMLGAERFYWEADAHLLDDLQSVKAPIVLFGTAFAFVQLFDIQEGPLTLPEGSLIIETGGFKGRTREVSRTDLYRLFTEQLGVDPQLCYSEYGMSEMASQFYSRGLDDLKLGPHWVRTRIIDPLTGADPGPDGRGLLAHYDLANFNSVMAVQTEDVGVMATSPVGRSGFRLLGRAHDAETRGCSLTAEELWERGAGA
ncbi:MAG: hypothetical protein ACLQVD_03075 [Capsulimonadaceae bacterium]